MRRRKFLKVAGATAFGLWGLGMTGCATGRGMKHGSIQRNNIFISGTEGYDTFRIPSILTSENDTLLALCEGRKESRSDTGNIDLVLRRSENNGKTWSDLRVLWDDGQNVCGNPCIVQDEETGTLHLLMTHNLGEDSETEIIKGTGKSTRTVWISRSKDDGISWSDPEEITSSVKKESWGWYATGPGVGTQIRHGEYKGRLIIPCDHSYDDPHGDVRGGPYGYGSHVIYSDDHGETWHLGGVVRPKVNECQVVEVADGQGTLLLNMRSYHERHCRMHARSYDGGISWTKPFHVSELIEPVCQASILRAGWPEAGNGSRILFSNPSHPEERVNMTVQMSLDEGKSWPVKRVLHEGPSAYSCLTVLPDNSIGCLFESGEEHPYERIELVQFSVDYLLNNV